MRAPATLTCAALIVGLACGGGGGGSGGSDDALASLTSSVGTLSPYFSPEMVFYTLDLPGSADFVTFTLTARAGARITIAVGDHAPVPVESGQALNVQAPWPGGHGNFYVNVTAGNGNTRTYTVVMRRGSDFCGADQPVAVVDGTLPQEPRLPTTTCAVLNAVYAVGANGLPVFTHGTSAYDTSRIQAAINACTAGSVKLQVDPGDATHAAFVSGPLQLKANVTLWVDQGVTLFASRNPRDYDKPGSTCPSTPATTSGCCASSASGGSNCIAFITVKGTSSSFLPGAGIMGAGTIDGLGGEPMIGGYGTDANASWWDYANAMDAAGRSFSNPRLVDVTYAQDFTLHGITLQNSPKFHVGLESDGFVVWGVTIHTPSRSTNSVGRALSPAMARNTDGIDPYNANDGWIVFSNISTGDDQIALKCGDLPIAPAGNPAPSCRNITIAHNHFGTGHGMSIGSEINAGKSDGTGVGIDGLHVYDLSIDGLLPNGGAGNVNLNGIRIKSDVSRGGIVRNVVYEDVCMRGLASPILVNPRYDNSATGSAIPTFQNVTFRNVRHFDCTAMPNVPAPGVRLDGYDASHLTSVTLDGVVIDGMADSAVRAQYATVTLGPGPVSFTPSGTSVTVTDGRTGAGTPNSCAGKFVPMPWQ